MDTAIRLHNVTKNYESFTLDHITMDIPKGCIVGLVGENGAGKTTLLKAILDMIHLDEGQISLDGVPVSRLSYDWKKEVGVILSGLDFAASMNAREIGNIMAGTYENWQQNVYEAYLQRFKIEPGKTVQKYSKGMKMKLNIAVALSHQAKLLIFDEATSGLDPTNSRLMKNMILAEKSRGKTILLTTHNMQDATELCDRVAFIVGGQIFALDSPHNLIMSRGAANVIYTWNDNGEQTATCPLCQMSEDKQLQRLIAEKRIQSIHSSEPTLNDIFMEITGRTLV